MTLRVWAANGWLKAHAPAREEITTLLIAADNDLRDATTPDLHRDNKHFRSIAALMFTLGAGSEELINFLDHCRTMRHDATYDGVRRISRAEADELIAAVGELQAGLTTWLRNAHPDLA